jgi:hypothetical protein
VLSSPSLRSLCSLLTGCGGNDESATTTEDPGEIAFPLDEQEDSGAVGVRATLTYETRDRTKVVVDGLDEGEPAGGGANPAWIYQGSCNDLGEVAEKLNPLQGPSSETTVGLGLTALINGDYAIAVGVPRSQGRIAACGDVPDEAPAS